MAMESQSHPTSARHVVSIPYPGRGHVNPMMNLCRLLAARGLHVTVVVTEEWRRMLISEAEWPLTLAFRAIPDVLPSERTRGDDFGGFIAAVFSKMEAPVDALLAEIVDPPVDLVVADSFLEWAARVAGRRGLPVASLWTQSATIFRAFNVFGELDDDRRLAAVLSGKGNEPLAYLPKVDSPHFGSIAFQAPILQFLSRFMSIYSWFSTAQSLIFTTFYELESQAFDNLRTQLPLPVYSLGPCIPYITLGDTKSDTNSHCMKWLDSQSISSVLYISLGSFLPMSGPQVDEMASGLLASGVRFLWVARGESEILKGIGSDTGLVVSWCDQLRVLSHPSVGGFLTHCGWNSTLEGVFAGVPMLTFPLIWDQFSNSKLIVDDWKVGLRLKDEDDDMVVGQEKITRVVKELMDFNGEENKGLRKRAAELRDNCSRAIQEGGSSSANLDNFVQDITSKKHNSS